VNDASTGVERLLRAPAVTVAGSPGLGFRGGGVTGLQVARGEWIARVNDTPAARGCAARCSRQRARCARRSVAAQIRFAGKPDTVNSAGLEVDDSASPASGAS
jgi:hypothetical protein